MTKADKVSSDRWSSSLKWRLLMGTACGMFVILTAAGILLYSIVRASLINEFDSALEMQARSLAVLIEDTTKGIEFELIENKLPQRGTDEPPVFYQVFADGEVFAQSDFDSPPRFPGVTASIDRPGFDWVTSSSNQPMRFVKMHFFPPMDMDEDDDEIVLHGTIDKDDKSEEVNEDASEIDEIDTPLSSVEVTLLVAKDTSDLNRSLASFYRSIAGVFLLTMAVSLLVLNWLINRGLHPLTLLANQLRSVDHDNLSKRIDLSSAPTEMVPVVSRLNELLDRLDFAFQREKDFSSDVAHELRTPLAGLKSNLELALSRTRDAESYKNTIAKCHQITNQTHLMVENLLELARLENDSNGSRVSRFDLGHEVVKCWNTFAETAKSRSIKVQLNVESPLPLESDLEKIKHVIRNIFDNAISYVDPGGKIEISATLADNKIRLNVVNSGNRISSDQLPRVFDRFWRGDESRTDTETHSGLGLSLCQRMMERLDGSIDVQAGEPDNFRILVTVPAI